MQRSRSRLIGIGIGIGVALSGGLLAVAKKVVGRRRTNKKERTTEAFKAASDGLWPPVPRAEGAPVVIDAPHPQSAEADQEESS